ncbi:hypothetical protein PSACC_03024 [Paramicrosporidium saccamoebae]|uniref:Uncharacterized protein n=1 Tax=Paramicrosporidium saccamoebae TaxID=1246581 RepID=A0A2H9THB0_9FUNG|nr:hypothetical protein PSACC_03024 [Paramicrosporidium saccamoebae]
MHRILNSISARRPISSQEMVEDDTGNEDFFAAAIGAPTESTSYPAWITGMRAKLSVGSGPVFLGKNSPFPYNSEFRPSKPVTDEFRTLVLATWESDPTRWTPRQLSIKFKVSIERIKAIIKLKLLQRKMESTGFQINRKYLKQMETHLGASMPSIPEADGRNFSVTENLPPKLIAIPEEAKLSHNEAAALLGRELRPIHEAIDADLNGDVPFIPHKKQSSPEELAKLIIQTDPYERSRWKFVFTDISADVKPADRLVLIRERNGNLRKADTFEQVYEVKQMKNRVQK